MKGILPIKLKTQESYVGNALKKTGGIILLAPKGVRALVRHASVMILNATVKESHVSADHNYVFSQPLREYKHDKLRQKEMQKQRKLREKEERRQHKETIKAQKEHDKEQKKLDKEIEKKRKENLKTGQASKAIIRKKYSGLLLCSICDAPWGICEHYPSGPPKDETGNIIEDWEETRVSKLT